LAVIATGDGNDRVCHPEAVSFAKVAVASCVPLAVHRVPVWVPVFCGPL
jgi:hypothetical protein